MKDAVVLCAGAGTKIWPYAQIRSKVMMPISNRPIVSYVVDSLQQLGVSNIVLVAGPFAEEIRAYFRGNAAVRVIDDPQPKGTAASLLCAAPYVQNDFLTLYGDTIPDADDLRSLTETFAAAQEHTALVSKMQNRTSDCIGCAVADGKLTDVFGHSRDDGTHQFAAFAFRHDLFSVLPYTPIRFPYTDVGMMTPVESHLEALLGDLLRQGETIRAVETAKPFFDIDRPWDILYANHEINFMRCGALTENRLAQGASIDPSASISGFVQLGKNSSIGKNVIISGNIIVGDDTEIKNGAILQGNIVIGDRSRIRNACYIDSGSTVGNECVVSHAAELDGMILDRVYLYHYMEWCGLIGLNTDLGAATVCGSLRFDDSITMQRVKGRKEPHNGYGDAVFLGDYCRTGVNAILMPGVKVGVYSVVGAGVILQQDVPDRTLVYCKQELQQKPWGPEQYGW